jgi:hypothetical protein
MRDSNWSADYPQAAQKVAWFYSQEGGTPVDGVIALDTQVIVELLKYTGPIVMPDYNLTINSDNFIQTVQYQVEIAYQEDPKNWEINEPKTILKDIIPILFDKMEQLPKTTLISLAFKLLNQKDILLYFNNNDLENIVLKNNWGGAVPGPAELEDKIGSNYQNDYLYINRSNWGTNKSSLSIKQEVELKLTKNNSGQISNELIIVRTHVGENKWPDGENIEYIRIFVPKGSILKSVTENRKDITADVAVNSEAGKTTFEFWDLTEVASSNIIKIDYQIPYSEHSGYGLYVQKQPGTIGDNLRVILDGIVVFDDTLSVDRIIREK